MCVCVCVWVRLQLQLQTYASAATTTEDDMDHFHEADDGEGWMESGDDAERRLRSKLHRHFQQFRIFDFSIDYPHSTKL